MSIQSLLSPDPNSNEGILIQPPTPPTTTNTRVSEPKSQIQIQEDQDQETMRCDEAWKQLKVSSTLDHLLYPTPYPMPSSVQMLRARYHIIYTYSYFFVIHSSSKY